MKVAVTHLKVLFFVECRIHICLQTLSLWLLHQAAVCVCVGYGACTVTFANKI